MRRNAAGLSIHRHGKILEVSYLVGLLHFFFRGIAIIIIMITGRGEQWIFKQQIVFIDIEKIGLEFGVPAAAVGVVAQQDPRIHVVVPQVTDKLISYITLVDGIVTAITYDTDAVEAFCGGNGQSREIVIRSGLQGVPVRTNGIIVPGAGLQAFQLYFMFRYEDRVLGCLVQLPLVGSITDNASYEGIGPPADDDAVGGRNLEIGTPQEIGAGLDGTLGY